jgi:basic amino acid/polyamine antiporter, APA family
LNGIWASLLVLWGNFDQLLFFFAFANWLFFALAGISVFALRKKSVSAENFSMMGYPWVPWIFIVSSLLLCLISIVSAPFESLFGALLILVGFPIYWLVRSR